MLDALVIVDFMESFALTVGTILLMCSLRVVGGRLQWTELGRVRGLLVAGGGTLLIFLGAYLLAWPFRSMLLAGLLRPSTAYISLTDWIYDLQYESTYHSLYGVHLRIAAEGAFFLLLLFATLSFRRQSQVNTEVRDTLFKGLVVGCLAFGGWLGTYIYPAFMKNLVEQTTKTVGQPVAGVYLEGLLLMTVGIGSYSALLAISAYVAQLGLAKGYFRGFFAAIPAVIAMRILVQTLVLKVIRLDLVVFTVALTVTMSLLLGFVAWVLQKPDHLGPKSREMESSGR